METMMIDETSTLSRFGYKSTDLTVHSGKPIVMVCVKCGRIRVGRKVDYRERCNRCVEKSPDGRARISLALTGRHRVFTDEWRARLKRAARARCDRAPRSKESIEKQRKTITGKGNPRYGIPAAHGKRIEYTSHGKSFILRSSWELKVAEYLDNHIIKFDYECKTFPIVYELLGCTKDGTYTPDFYLPDTDEYIEVKGIWRDHAKLKYDACILQYPHVKINLWDKNILVEKGIL
jgi:hypothetical protein